MRRLPLLVATAMLGACGPRRFACLVTESAPVGYPVEVPVTTGRPRGTVEAVRVYTLNGEVERPAPTASVRAVTAVSPRALPHALDLRWTTPRGAPVLTRLRLDPDEVRAAFGEGSGPYTLDLLPCDEGDHGTVTVVGAGGARTLERVEVSVGSTR